MSYYVYMLKSIEKKPVTYVGYTSSVQNRIKLHNAGKGAKFTRGRSWKLMYFKKFKTKNKAMKIEYKLKDHVNESTLGGDDESDCIGDPCKTLSVLK